MIQTEPKTVNQEIGQRAQVIYERDIKPLVEPEHHGEYLVLDVDTGQYVIDPDDLAVGLRAMELFPNGNRFGFRIGYPAMYSMRGGWGSSTGLRGIAR